MQEQLVPVLLGGAVGVLALVTVGLAVALWRGRVHTRAELARAREEGAALRAEMAALEQRLAEAAAPAAPEERSDYVITRFGEAEDDATAAPVVEGTIDRTLFADLVLRETVVRAGGLAHGLRRALSPEVRNRIRFEVRREVKRSRKQRRADLREARRAWEAHQRSAVRLDDGDAA
jgi:hypothetical protein